MKFRNKIALKLKFQLLNIKNLNSGKKRLDRDGLKTLNLHAHVHHQKPIRK